MADRRDKYEVQHLADMAKYDKKIWAIFKKVCHEAGLSVSALESIVKAAGKDAVFARIPAVRKVLDKLQRKLADSLKTTVVDGIKAEWSLANKKYDALVGTLGGGDLWEQLNEANRIKMMAQNLAVRDAFIARKEGGLDLSQRVWNYSGQMRDAMELALEEGIWEGRSAAEIARELQQYLKNPDKLFRRVRDKETGELKLSKPASLYHPGQGVYRSSYQNAVRLARTETNIAYRKSDTVRREGLYFVVGIEIHLSNNHNCKGVKEGEFHDICDELAGKYPADFDFSGWHPNCYSDDSEVLTNRGWLLFRDVLPNDWVLSLNPDTRRLEWTTIVATQSYRYAGRMVRFHNRSLDCLVTPEHRMVYLNKADGRIKYCEAAEYTKGKGGFYRGCEYSAADINTITIAGTTFDFDAFCRFMGYWLADGACFNTSGITISQNDGEAAKPNIIEAVKALGYEPTVYPDSVRFYHSAFVRYLRRFGHCKDKYIPDEIKRASRRQIALFLDAFVECDGSIRPPKDFVGNRGTHFHGERGERVFFTTSRRMAGDLCELILKAGGRPSVREREPGAATKKDGTVIRSNYTCFIISDLKAVTATVFDKEFVDYDGMVYDLTLAKNHIMYIKRKGRCFWGSNCRCWTSTILQTDEEFIRDSDGVYRGSVNEVKDVPPQFKEWVDKNRDRIESADGRNSLSYFLRDNRKYWQDEDGKVMYGNTTPPIIRYRHISDSTLDDYEKQGLITATEKADIKKAKNKDAQTLLQQSATNRISDVIRDYVGMYESRNPAIRDLLLRADAKMGYDEVGRIKLLNKVKDLCAKECIDDLKAWGAIDKGLKYVKLERMVDVMQYGVKTTTKGESVTIPRVTRDLVVFADAAGREYAYPVGVTESLLRYKASAAAVTMADTTKMPEYLSSHLKRITFMNCANPMDPFWEKEYKYPNFQSQATDGSRTTFWMDIKTEGDLLWTMRHEMGHMYDFAHGISSNNQYKRAAKKDAYFPTSYAEKAYKGNGKYEEDFADSIREYIANPFYFKKHFPNRAAIIEKYIKLYPKH